MVSNTLPETFKTLVPQGPGILPLLQDIPLEKPGNNEVLVKIAFASLNPSDIGSLYGSYKGKISGKSRGFLGFEGSGTIVAVGENLLIPHKVGERVHVIGPGTYAEYCIASSENCLPIQGDLSFELASPHIVNPGTVHYMGYLAKQGGHKAAIHTAGSSALGRMLIRYFKHLGIKLINVVRRDDYNEELKNDGADYILNSTAPDFEAQLKEIATKENATIAFDAVAGDFTNKVVTAQPSGSICYVYGGLGGREAKVDIFQLFDRKQVAGLYLTNYTEDLKKSGEIFNFFKDIHTLLPTILRTEIQKVFTLDQIQEALAYYKDNSSKGKILFKP